MTAFDRLAFGPAMDAADKVRALWAVLRRAAAVRRERRALATLDHRLLRDIGVSEADATLEARRALWDLPVRR